MTIGRQKETTSTTNKKPCVSEDNKLRPITDFYMSNSKFHTDGRYPVCKHCLKKDLDTNKLNQVQELLRNLDRPFIYELWVVATDEATRRNREVFGTYIKQIQLNHKDWDWKDSVFELKKEGSEEQSPVSRTSTTDKRPLTISDEIVDKWGEGYTDEEYRLFEKKWKKLIDNYGEKTALHTEGLVTYIRFRVKEEMATANGDLKGAKDWGALATKASQDAKLNVSQLSKSDISGGVDLMSQLFEAVESEVGVIPLLPRLLEQPYDDADMVIWSIVNYTRRLEDKPSVPYRDVWNFYDDMLEEHFKQQNFNNKQIKEFKAKRNNVFRDLSEVYKEPLYEGED